MGKIVAILGGLVGLLASILFLFEGSLGWWEVVYTPIFGNAVRGDLSPFGTYQLGTGDVEMWGGLFLFSGIIFVLASVLLIVASAKESKGGAILCAILMIVGLGLFIYALGSDEGLLQIKDFLDWIGGSEYNVYFGSVDFGFLGAWAWRFGNGFFIAIAGAVIGLIGAFYIKK